MKIIITGGGTGGHVFPGLAIAEALQILDPDVDILFAGTSTGMESHLVPEAGYRFVTIPASGVRGLGWRARFRFAANLVVGVAQSLVMLARFQPDVVLGTGGYVGVPVMAAARLQRRVMALQEQNSVPGSANKVAARWASKVYLGFQDAAESFPGVSSLWTGNPVRKNVITALTQEQAKPWSPDRPLRILVFGGSRGAHTLNKAMIEAAAAWAPREQLELWIQTGPADYHAVDQAYVSAATVWGNAGRRLRVEPFINDMPEALRWADLVIARAGAMTLAELTVTGLPSILVPFPHATDDHQTRNAQSLSKFGAAELLPDDMCTGESVVAMVDHLTADPTRLAAMAHDARAQARPDAAMEIAIDLMRLTGVLPASEERS
jgi:UDP-N-acetylglucosamine--N-acetylmuramyl-(pentapeptide) pyrophosphoryl-undecaprenol N-acetylglucosamine transferase